MINTAVISLVGTVCSREQEMGRVIDSWQSVVLCSVVGDEDKLEGTSLVLWFDRARDGEVGAHGHLKPLLLGLGDLIGVGRGGDVWLSQQIC